jgi:hypothetical protein
MRPTFPPPTMNSLFAARTRSRLTRVWNAPAPYEGIPPEEKRLLPGAGCDEEGHGPDEDVGSPLAEDPHPAVAERGQGHGVEPHLDRLPGADHGLEPGGDVDPPGPGVHGVRGPEEVVGLEDKLPSKRGLSSTGSVRIPRSLSSIAAESPAGPPPMMRTGVSIRGISLIRGGVGTRGLREAVCGLDPHPRPDWGHTRLDREPVGDDQALGALAVGAEDALGGPSLGWWPKVRIPEAERAAAIVSPG